jgi:hypothetical protein
MVKNDEKGCLAELRFKPVLTEALYMGFQKGRFSFLECKTGLFLLTGGGI